jgi:hypothetical protein
MQDQKKYIENLQKAIKELKIADHMIYVTYPVIKDKRLLIKALEQVYNSVISLINAILQYDFYWKKIRLSPEASVNFDIFITKSSKNYNISQNEISEIIELILLMESHKKSPMEFLRKEKIVIMSDSLKTNTLDVEKMKRYLNLAKRLIEKIKAGMSIN